MEFYRGPLQAIVDTNRGVIVAFVAGDDTLAEVLADANLTEQLLVCLCTTSDGTAQFTSRELLRAFRRADDDPE